MNVFGTLRRFFGSAERSAALLGEIREGVANMTDMVRRQGEDTREALEKMTELMKSNADNPALASTEIVKADADIADNLAQLAEAIRAQGDISDALVKLSEVMKSQAEKTRQTDAERGERAEALLRSIRDSSVRETDVLRLLLEESRKASPMGNPTGIANFKATEPQHQRSPRAPASPARSR